MCVCEGVKQEYFAVNWTGKLIQVCFCWATIYIIPLSSLWASVAVISFIITEGSADFGRLNAPCQRWRRLLSELLIAPLIKILAQQKKPDNRGSDLITLVFQPLVPDTQETIKSLLTSVMAFRESGPVWFILLITHRLWVIANQSHWGENMLMGLGNDAPSNLLRKKERKQYNTIWAC